MGGNAHRQLAAPAPAQRRRHTGARIEQVSFGGRPVAQQPRALIIRQRPQQGRELRPIGADADQPFALRPFFEPYHFLQGTRMGGQAA